jgi:AP-4 complex subunit beta-1
MIVYLLNRLKDFDEWGMSIILNLVARYMPRNKEELFDILNMLDYLLRHSCTSIVLGTIKIFLNYTKDKEKI